MAKIFISYRREDTESTTGRIYERLAKEYGKPSVMMDIDNIPSGVDFRNYIQEQLAECEVMIAIVGTKWLGPRRGRQPRINDDYDWVRLEIETALKRDIVLIPALVHNATMPKAESIPKGIVDFCFRNAATISTGQDFHNHLDRLIESLNRTIDSRRMALAQALAASHVTVGDLKTEHVQLSQPILARERAAPSDEPTPRTIFLTAHAIGTSLDQALNGFFRLMAGASALLQDCVPRTHRITPVATAWQGDEPRKPVRSHRWDINWGHHREHPCARLSHG